MTKEQLVELVRRRLPNPIHEQVIEKYLELAYGQLLDMLFEKDSTQMDQYVKLYYSIPVVSISGEESYSLLPTKIANLSGPGSGVRNIYTTTMSPKFAPMTRSTLDVLDGLEVLDTDPLVSFVTEVNVVRYIDMPVEIVKVNMGLVRSLEALDDTDEVLLPTIYDQQLIEMTINLLQGQPQQKKSNDNTSNPV